MKLKLQEAIKIASELGKEYVRAKVGQGGLDKLYFYVYSSDPDCVCKCSRKGFDAVAKKTAEKRLSRYDNVVVTIARPVAA